MENIVLIVFEEQTVFVNKRGLTFSFTRDLLKNIPSDVNVNDIEEIWWKVDGQNRLMGASMSIPFGEEHYDDYVKPYVDIWQTEKNKLEKERQEAEAEYNRLPNVKARKLDELNAAHETAEADAHVLSSLGFEIDANDRANRDVEGILKTIGDGTTLFCDYNNEFHELNKAQVETLQVEIIQNAQALYAQKWQYRTQVEAAESVEELGAIEFTFSQMRF